LLKKAGSLFSEDDVNSVNAGIIPQKDTVVSFKGSVRDMVTAEGMSPENAENMTHAEVNDEMTRIPEPPGKHQSYGEIASEIDQLVKSRKK
jgi:hypothetical protein